MELLKLAALDADDLGVISAHLQDAVLKVGDIKYFKKSGKLVLIANRFAWEVQGESQRRRTALHFDQVRDVKAQRVTMDDPHAVLSLLAIEFKPAEEPAGAITLQLSGGGAIRLAVECIEARLEDLGPAWDTANTPSHDK